MIKFGKFEFMSGIRDPEFVRRDQEIRDYPPYDRGQNFAFIPLRLPGVSSGSSSLPTFR